MEVNFETFDRDPGGFIEHFTKHGTRADAPKIAKFVSSNAPFGQFDRPPLLRLVQTLQNKKGPELVVNNTRQ